MNYFLFKWNIFSRVQLWYHFIHLLTSYAPEKLVLFPVYYGRDGKDARGGEGGSEVHNNTGIGEDNRERILKGEGIGIGSGWWAEWAPSVMGLALAVSVLMLLAYNYLSGFHTWGWIPTESTLDGETLLTGLGFFLGFGVAIIAAVLGSLSAAREEDDESSIGEQRYEE